MDAFERAYGDELRAVVERLLAFDTSGGAEAPAQSWLEGRLDDLGFGTYRWTADADALAAHPSFPDDPAAIDTADRPSVAGVLELGTGEGPTLVLNGHVDVVPADGDDAGAGTDGGGWSSPPFEPTWDGDALTARGAADTKAGLGACVVAARHLADRVEAGEVDAAGRVVVESVAGEEEGGIGAAAAALDSPYPFERDAAVVAEPTGLRPVVATAGSLMARVRVDGRSAHAATRWHGESALDHFERVRVAFADLERERADRVTHPLYGGYPVPWPVVCGRVRAGSWASTVPGSLTSEWRIGVAPGETVAGVEAEFRERLREVAAADGWTREHPPTLDRVGVQFEPAEVAPDQPVVRAVRAALDARGRGAEPAGATYGADARHYIEAGIPTVVFGPGSVEQAHFPDETVHWPDVLAAGSVLSGAAARYLSK